MTNRENETVLANIQDIFKKMGVPKNLNADNEFNTKMLNEYFQKNNITCHFSEVGEINKNAIVERFNRTLAGLLQKWRQATKGRTWYKVLPEIIENYNNTYHRTVKAKPVDIFSGDDTNKQTDIVITHPTFKVGDIVRYKEVKNILGKGDYVKYSEDTYIVKEVKGKKFKLENTRTGKPPSRMYKDYELKLADSIETYEEKPVTEPEYKEAKKTRKAQAERKEIDYASKKLLRSGTQFGEREFEKRQYKTYLKKIDAPKVVEDQTKKILRSKKEFGTR